MLLAINIWIGLFLIAMTFNMIIGSWKTNHALGGGQAWEHKLVPPKKKPVRLLPKKA